MSEAENDTDYPVLVTERAGRYEVRIRELFLVVRGPDLQKAYEEVIRRKQEIIDSAYAFGTQDDLPQAERPALLEDVSQGLFGRLRSKLGWRQ
jgi:hypothetical protein